MRGESRQPANDAFGRLRVSNPTTLFDSKQLFDNQPNFWDDQEVSGSGTSSSHSANTASTTLAVTADTAGKRVRQTYMRFNYQPGKSLLFFITGTLGTGGGAGITRSMGYFDDENGIFLSDIEGTVNICKRSYITGSAVDTNVPQADWNLDTLDGSGDLRNRSKYTLDSTKSQIVFCDLEWLGVGRVRCGFVIDGSLVYCHEFAHSNEVAGVYMSTPNLPMRYEIENDGTGVESELEAICSSVISEGGLQNNGIVFSANTGSGDIDANVVGTSYALLGLRLKSTHLGTTIKMLVESVLATTSDDFLWEARWNPTVAGTFTYNDVANSSVQIATGDTTNNPSTNTVTGGQIIRSGYVEGSTAASFDVTSSRALGAAIDGTPDEVVLCVTPLSANLDIFGSITWRELQ